MDEKSYKKWLNMSKIICNNKEIAEEVLQELLLHMLETNNKNLYDSYIFISLKNRFLNYLKKEKNRKIDYTDNENTNLTELLEDDTQPEDIEELIKKNFEDQDKLNIITETILSLPSYDKKLYQLHMIWNLSQRQIAKKIGISHMNINIRINKIKEKIRENYEKGKSI